jgi:hypothetical protein
VVTNEIERGNAAAIAGDSFSIDNAGCGIGVHPLGWTALRPFK